MYKPSKYKPSKYKPSKYKPSKYKPSKYKLPWLWPFQGYQGAIWSCQYVILYLCLIITWPNSSSFTRYKPSNLSDLDFNLPRSPVSNVVVLRVDSFHSHIWPNSAHLWGMGFQNLSDLDVDLWRSHKVKSDGTLRLNVCMWFPISV